MAILTASRLENIEMLRDGGTLVAQFLDDSGWRWNLLFQLDHASAPDRKDYAFAVLHNLGHSADERAAAQRHGKISWEDAAGLMSDLMVGAGDLGEHEAIWLTQMATVAANKSTVQQQ